MPTPDPNAAVYADLCRIMNESWDPIGIQPADINDGEYLAYSARVYVMLKAGFDAKAIEDYLNRVCVTRMELHSEKYRTRIAAEQIHALKKRHT